MVIDTTVGARAQLDTDYAMRGRVLAALAVTGSVSAAVGAPLLGWLSEHAGPRQTLVLAGAVTAVATAVAAIALDRLRDRRVRRRVTLAMAAPAVRRPVRRVAATAARIVRPATTAAATTAAATTAAATTAARPRHGGRASPGPAGRGSPSGLRLAGLRPGSGRLRSSQAVRAADECAGCAPPGAAAPGSPVGAGRPPTWPTAPAPTERAGRSADRLTADTVDRRRSGWRR